MRPPAFYTNWRVKAVKAHFWALLMMLTDFPIFRAVSLLCSRMLIFRTFSPKCTNTWNHSKNKWNDAQRRAPVFTEVIKLKNGENNVKTALALASEIYLKKKKKLQIKFSAFFKMYSGVGAHHWYRMHGWLVLVDAIGEDGTRTNTKSVWSPSGNTFILTANDRVKGNSTDVEDEELFKRIQINSV